MIRTNGGVLECARMPGIRMLASLEMTKLDGTQPVRPDFRRLTGNVLLLRNFCLQVQYNLGIY